MPTRLSGLDAAFLYLETATTHMHVGSVLICDANAVRGRLTRDTIAAYVEQRLHLAPPFRRRLAEVPFRLDHPVWVEDPDFDLDFHVRRAALPAPGGMAELAEFTGDVMSRRIDRGRPLWELYVVEGLAPRGAEDEGERLVLVAKTHHAAVDGVSGAELAAALLQLDPDAEPPPPARPWQPETPPSEVGLLAGAALRMVGTPVGLARTSARALRAATGVLRARGDAERAEPPPAPFAAPNSVLNGSIGPHRRVAFAELPLDTVKGIKNRLGGRASVESGRRRATRVTVNDVVLATVAGALRRFLQHRGQPPLQPLVAMVPISVRAYGERAELGNRVSAMLVALPVDEPDPVARLRQVSGGTAGAKEQHGALGADTMQQLAELAPGAVSSLAARLYTRMRGADRHRPIWNTIVSNVPGPRIPLYCAGARLEALYPLGPVHEMCGLNITLFSYRDMVFVGLNADRELLPDVARIAGELRESVDELAKAADQQVQQ